MSEIATVKQFTIAMNQQFPGGTLFLLLGDKEFKRHVMDLSSRMLESTSNHQKYAVRMIGRNQLDEEEPIWVFSECVQLSNNGLLLTEDESPFLWLQRIVNGSNILLQESLKCTITTPLDELMDKALVIYA